MQAFQPRVKPVQRTVHTNRWPANELRAAAENERFLDLLAAYRMSGGLATGHEISARRPVDGLSELARVIAAREVIGVEWSGQRWLPFFQFERGDVAVRQPVRALVREMSDFLDDWELAEWMVQPNQWLDDSQPLHLLTTDFARVYDAARALRFVRSN